MKPTAPIISLTVVLSGRRVLRAAKREIIRETIAHTHGNITKAAKLLGVSRQSLQRMRAKR